MSIVVTAASGRLGRLVVESLLDRGTDAGEVVATSRDVGRLADLADRGVVTRPADFADPASLAAAFEGATRVLLVSVATVEPRRVQHGNVITAAGAAGVELLAYTSIPHAESATTILGRSHRETEQMILDAGLPYAFLRNSWYAENYTAQTATILEHGLVGAGRDGKVSPATRADYAASAAAVLTGDADGQRIFELGGAGLTLADVAATFAATSGRPVAYHDLPPSELLATLTSNGLPDELAEVLVDADRGLAQGELYADPADLERLLGRPATPFAEAVRAALAD